MDENGSLNANHSMDFEMKFVTSKHVHWVILSVLIVLMNSFVILLFVFNKNLQKPTNFLLVSLSVSDLLTGMIGLPLVLVCSTRPICLACVFSYTFIVFTSISTVLHILVISYERYIKIVFPFRVHQIGRASFELKLVACLWFISLLIPPIQFIWWPPTPTSCDEDLSPEDARSERIFTILIMVLFVALPVLLLIYADAMVFLVVRRQLDGIEKTSVGLRDSQRRLQKETRVLMLFAIMMLYFIVAWSFYFSSMVMHSIVGREMLLPEWIFQFAEILRCSTPFVNPILYILLKLDFRRAVLGVMRRLLRKYSGMQVDSSVEYSNGIRSGGRSDSRSNYTERTMFL
ncbi:adenosine receptor A2b-like [Dendronephthya gigantea]|uniref:adenosine receptor A2b-like n=1 Tax=Dendronephthya gigantea TaxID=151771 RepID=UPI00106A84F2|nr:adenosine receptor A2b-like [Dendronephthya gigantea]XP_028409853.1 adenosine receptor A2b-like [Dendronephthya gigantea]XP_028409854.1 adenosine receptor A2b-like [Dendronephthya gigantea]XP_028409855.1 adenosine receptor A2b-like [Dendronephthya gigantea]